MLAIISKLSEKLKKISPRAIFISVGIFIVSAIIINTLPSAVLSHSMRENAREQVVTRAQEIAGGNPFTAEKNERIIFTNEFARVTYDSRQDESLNGKLLIIPPAEDVFLKEAAATVEFREEGLIAYTMQKSEAGAVYIWKIDKGAAAVVSDTRLSLLIITFVIGIILIAVICSGAGRTKKRIDKLIKKLSTENDGEPIILPGGDEITQLAEKLNELAKKMQEAEEMRSTFVSDASHELRTPLSSIQLLVDSIIQTENIDMETTREFMIDISEQIERLTRIAERLLILTNLDGAKALALEPVDMKKVAESVIATLEQSALEARVELKCTFADGVTFMGTPDGTYQVIFNLVENAIKYNRPGGIVRVYIFKNDGVCNLIVDDNGIGIPEEDFEHIFERFYRVDKARSRDKGGSGLGLSIVAKIVGYFGGEIKVEPSVDGGVRFTVAFPEEVAK